MVAGASPKLLTTASSADVSGPWSGTLLIPSGGVHLGPPPNRDHRGAVFANSIMLQGSLQHESFPWESIRGARQACAITPKVVCVKALGNGNYVARFDYDNAVKFAGVLVPSGPGNYFVQAPQSRGQPQGFLPGFTASQGKGVFDIPFDGNDLTWVVGGRTATASRNSPACP
jgi:hypothetical protein